MDLLRLLDELERTGRAPQALILGGGCSGLALGTAMAEAGRSITVVEARTRDRDNRTWCYWDTGEALLPEAVSRSWDRWEIRTADGRATASDPGHPYRMVRAHDYRVAARRRIAASPHGRIVDGIRVTGDPVAYGSQGGPAVVDARGPASARSVPPGRVLLDQQFFGQWIRTTRPTFDDSTVTLMDFGAVGPGRDVCFFYVLPVAPDLALVEYTVFSSTGRSLEPFRRQVSGYLERRWGLAADGWTVEGEETGSIPMTDARPERTGLLGSGFGIRAGVSRPSSGYAYTRIQAAARRGAVAFEEGAALPTPRDRFRTRVLDAIFLRFLRDQPQRAPAAFLRLFHRLPGPLTIRFLTERSSVLDEVRLVLALPKAPFLLAAATTVVERARARGR